MTQNRDSSALVDIYRAASKATEFSQGFDEGAFLAEERTQSAIPHQLLVIGEAVKRLSTEFRRSHPDIRWTPMAGMRDVLIHAYDTVDLDEVWRTVTVEIPQLINKLVSLLPVNPSE